jgi:chromosome segregation ATPase
MSTAGKVLVVLVTLTTLVWMILASGVAQLNRNGNKAVHDLSETFAKTQVNLEEARAEIVAYKDQTSSIQQKDDYNLNVLRAHDIDVKEARSQIIDTLKNTEFELSTLQDTIKAAQTDLLHRNEELAAEEKALGEAKSEVQALMAESNQLASRLKGLRQTFQTTYKANVEQLGKISH